MIPDDSVSYESFLNFQRQMEVYTSISLRMQGYELKERERITDSRCRQVMEFYKTGSEMQGVSEAEKLVTCFMLQRFLCKWGGEMLKHNHPSHRAWRQLMLETAGIDPVPMPDRRFGELWFRLSPAEKEAVLAEIRDELANTEYEPYEGGLDPINKDAAAAHLDAHHAFWVHPCDFLAGEYPNKKGAKEMPPILRSLLDAGISCFIDLTEEGELEPYAQFLEGREHLRFPIRDVNVPKSKDEMRAILDAIDERLDVGKGVYLHCWGGVGRTGTVAGCWLARHGEEDPLQKLQILWQNSRKSKIGRQCPETEAQRRFVQDGKAGE